MKTQVSYHDLADRKTIERELHRQQAKLMQRLKKVDPDLLSLHVSLVRRTRSVTRFVASVTLHMPSGQLNASEEDARPLIALKHSFGELFRELTKHQAKLRGEPAWRRLRRRQPPTPT